jgi:hypothetical protein
MNGMTQVLLFLKFKACFKAFSQLKMSKAGSDLSNFYYLSNIKHLNSIFGMDNKSFKDLVLTTISKSLKGLVLTIDSNEDGN